ncbi:hypothetical protein B0H19DRAFT_1083537 [Mycena capillaripes]|nr:hypothetical protein B0H19DRAFT_1083537 [Mycena capillaripes]
MPQSPQHFPLSLLPVLVFKMPARSLKWHLCLPSPDGSPVLLLHLDHTCPMLSDTLVVDTCSRLMVIARSRSVTARYPLLYMYHLRLHALILTKLDGHQNRPSLQTMTPPESVIHSF